MRNFAEILKLERKALSLSQTELGKKMNCERYRVADLERGKIAPTIEDLNILCDLFSVSSDYLIGRTEIRTTDPDYRTICESTGLSENSVEALSTEYAEYNLRKHSKVYFESGIVPVNPLNVLNYFLQSDEFFECLSTLEHSRNKYQKVGEIAEFERTHYDDSSYPSPGLTTQDLKEIKTKARYTYLDAIEAFRACANAFIKESHDDADKEIKEFEEELKSILW